MESELIDRVQNSLRDLIYPDAIFKCELLCAEFPLEVHSIKDGDSPGGITDSSFEDGVKRASVVEDYKGRLHKISIKRWKCGRKNVTSEREGKSYVDLLQDLMEKTVVLALATAMEYMKLMGNEDLSPEHVIWRDRIALVWERGGSSEVLFARRSDAFQALKRYNNVQLDGRLMRIEIEGSKSKIPISARVNVVEGLNGQRTVVMRPSAETLFELICTWLHKGNYFESATKHDQPETEGPVGRLTKRNLQRLYGCQSNVVYGRSQLIDGLPPQVLRQILEILNFLATNHSCVADILFYFNSTRGLESLNTGIYDMNDKGKEKPLSVVHDEERMHDGLVVPPIPTAPTPPILEVTVSRPVDPICRIASQPRVLKPPYAPPLPPPLPTLHGVVSLPPFQDVVPSLQPPPPPPMLSDKVYTLTGELLKKLASIAPSHRKFFIVELSDLARSLSSKAVQELITLRNTHMLGLSTGSMAGSSVLRILQTLNSPHISDPSLPLGTQRLLPFIEAFLVLCDKLQENCSLLQQDNACATESKIK
ncbi:hypothetical protein Tco_1563286 [Tanacetum coccineum]